MYCKNCGAKMKEGAAFCPKCGMSVAKMSEKGGTTGKQKKKMFFTGVLILLVILLVAAVFLLISSLKKHPGTAQEESILYTQADDRENYPVVTKELAEQLTEEAPEGFSRFDLEEMKHTPGKKTEDMEWDAELFYQIEGIGEEYPSEVGLLGECAFSQYCLTDTSSDSEIFCEVYSDRSSSEIYKISTLSRYGDGTWDVIDYYYKNGKPYFVFQREDTVYVPSLVSVKLPGTRFYFEDDTMVQVRTVLEDSLRISQTSLKPQGKAEYEEFDYFTAPDAVREQYDSYEREWLNRSYNIYEAVKTNAPVEKLTGTVRNGSGEGVAGYNVYLQDQDSGTVVCRMQTDENGRFEGYIDSRKEGNYQLYIEGKEGFQDLYVHEIPVTQGTYEYTCDDLILQPDTGGSSAVRITAVDAMSVKAGEGSTAVPAKMIVRKGINSQRGEYIFSSEMDENGQIDILDLSDGSYTLELTADGYERSYRNITVSGGTAQFRVYMIPALAEGESAYVLTWKEDSDSDLDLTLFTPHRLGNGYMDYVGGSVEEDKFQNRLVRDNAAECEVACGNIAPGNGTLKLYVADYTAIHKGDTPSWQELGVKLYIYQAGGRMMEYTPGNHTGYIWEVAALRNQSVISYNRFYQNIKGKTWWEMPKD